MEAGRGRAEGSRTQSLLHHRILDACAGAAVASIGHGDSRVISKIAEQLSTLSYHHTSRLTNPVRAREAPILLLSAPILRSSLLTFLHPQAAEKLAQILVGDRPGGLSHAIFLSSGSEANESAIKLARQYFVEIGESFNCSSFSDPLWLTLALLLEASPTEFTSSRATTRITVSSRAREDSLLYLTSPPNRQQHRLRLPHRNPFPPPPFRADAHPYDLSRLALLSL